MTGQAGRNASGKSAGSSTERQPSDRPSESRRLALVPERRGDLAPRRSGAADAEVAKPTSELGLAPGQEKGQEGIGLPGRSGRLALRPTAEEYGRVAGGPSPDRLEGVEEGEGTFLNTREWKYAGFFNRVKQAVVLTWDPNSVIRARDPTGSRFGYQDWTTGLLVKLDETGQIKGIAVEKRSGLEFLDQEAIQAFRRAQPFSNPPQGLVDGRGEIAFQFYFTLEMGGGGGFRILRRSGGR